MTIQEIKYERILRARRIFLRCTYTLIGIAFIYLAFVPEQYEFFKIVIYIAFIGLFIPYIWMNNVAKCPWCGEGFLFRKNNIKNFIKIHLWNCDWYKRTRCANCSMPHS